MIAVDTNVLLYAHQDGSPRQRAAQGILAALAGTLTPWAIPVFCLGELMRLLTHPRLVIPSYSPEKACEAVSNLLEAPSLTLLRPGPHYAQLLLEAIREVNAVGHLVFDAQIVALCREHGVSKLFTEDRDFDRFKGFRTERLEI